MEKIHDENSGMSFFETKSPCVRIKVVIRAPRLLQNHFLRGLCSYSDNEFDHNPDKPHTNLVPSH